MVEHFRPADLSGVEVESDALKGAVFYFFNCGLPGKSRAESKAALEGVVKRLGGTVRPGKPWSMVLVMCSGRSTAKLEGLVVRVGVPRDPIRTADSWGLPAMTKGALKVLSSPAHCSPAALAGHDGEPKPFGAWQSLPFCCAA